MSRWFGLRPILVCSALFVSSQSAFPQVKVAVVNLQRAVFESAEIKKADAEMQLKYKPQSDKLQQLQTEINRITQQLQAGQGKLTPQAESDLNMQAQRKQRDYQRATDDLQGEVDRERNEILQRSSQKMSEVVKKLAEEKGFDLVVDTATALYFKPAMDLTTDAIAAYDKAYPAAPPAPAAKK